MKIDIYKSKERYLNWKEKVQNSDLKDLNEQNSNLIKQYIFDMENGINVSNKTAKGSRSHIRLNTLRMRMSFIAQEVYTRFGVKCLSDLTEDIIMRLFSGMRNGEIKRKNGEAYQSVGDYVKVFKAYWHWWMKVNSKKGIEISDIGADLDTSYNKPKWVYFEEDQVKKLCDNAKFEYRVLIMFLYDSGIRSPTELINVKISDLSDDCKELLIRDEISKTFQRKIKLMLCPELLKTYIKENELKQEDCLFKNICYPVTNRYLQRLAKKLFGEKVTMAGKKYSEVTCYDFRHCSCCYWLPRYKSESALKYRFGWKKSDKIHYYSEMLGMKDTISEDDLLVDVTKTEIEKRLSETEKENTILKDKVSLMENQMQEIQGLTDILLKQIENLKASKEVLNIQIIKDSKKISNSSQDL